MAETPVDARVYVCGRKYLTNKSSHSKTCELIDIHALSMHRSRVVARRRRLIPVYKWEENSVCLG